MGDHDGEKPLGFSTSLNAPDGYHPILVPDDKRRDNRLMGDIEPLPEPQPKVPEADEIQKALGDTQDSDEDKGIPELMDFLGGINQQIKQKKRKEEDDV